jgi:hypothetical protein
MWREEFSVAELANCAGNNNSTVEKACSQNIGIIPSSSSSSRW